MPTAKVTLPGSASSVPAARRFVETLLASWGHPEVGWSAALCISELAANCALHARTDFTVQLTLSETGVRLEVSDGSVRVPAQRSYDAEATTGRGLRLLEEYASSWGVDLAADGKTVWVLLDLHDDPDVAVPGAAEDAEIDALLAAFRDPDDDVQALLARDDRLAA